jgi:hypothetical protein
MDSIFSRPFDSISQIKTGREVWKLPVKIVNIWNESDGPCRKHIEMVIMDSNVRFNFVLYLFEIKHL